MQKRWFFSTFFLDPDHNMWIPHCAAYGTNYICPVLPANPASGSALVLMWTSAHQLDAASQDTSVLIMPHSYNPVAVSAAVAAAYAASVATATMTLPQLLFQLSKTEPAWLANE